MADPSFDTLVPVRKSARPAAPPAAGAPGDPEPPDPVTADPVASQAAPRAVSTEEDGPRFIEGRGKVRRRRIPLAYPIAFRGREYLAITLRRPTAAEVGHFFERLIELKATDEGASLPFPIFVDDDGDPIPPEVLAYLDGEDDEAVLEASDDFLPPRLQRLRAAR